MELVRCLSSYEHALSLGDPGPIPEHTLSSSKPPATPALGNSTPKHNPYTDADICTNLYIDTDIGTQRKPRE